MKSADFFSYFVFLVSSLTKGSGHRTVSLSEVYLEIINIFFFSAETALYRGYVFTQDKNIIIVFFS